jgi:hypothetical protein
MTNKVKKSNQYPSHNLGKGGFEPYKNSGIGGYGAE